MRLRSLTDRPFLGCSAYPACRGLIGNEQLSAEVLAEAAAVGSRAVSRAVPAQQALPFDVAGPQPGWPTSFPGYGRAKGMPIREATMFDLDYYANGARRTLADSSKVRFHAKESTLLRAIEHEMARQRGATPRADPAPSPVADPFKALVEVESPADALCHPQMFYPPTVEECRTVPAGTLALDEHQQRLVSWRCGEAVDAACAGSGKSTCLIERIAALIREGCPPEGILTLVYNRSAAESLRKRLSLRLPGNMGARVHAVTFHSWAYSLVREWWPGRFAMNRIVGTEEGPAPASIAVAALKATGAEEGQIGFEIKSLVKISELAREALIDIYAEDASKKFMELPIDLEQSTAVAVVQFARLYQQEKARREVIDFADMLYLVNRVIAYGGARARALQARYQHVQVDEAQDISAARMEIASFLGRGARSLLWVGDFRQTVNSHAGARPDLLRSRLDQGATLLTMPVNRRSTALIVEAGNKIADGHDWNVGGACQATTDVPAEKVHIWPTGNGVEEANAIAEEIEARTHGGVPLVDPDTGKANYVCLVRTNAQAAALECSFLQQNLPCRVLGATGGVWSTAVGKELLAYLRCGTGYVDKEILRVANKPARFLKRAVVESVLSIAAIAKMDLNIFAEALNNVGSRGARQLRSDLLLLAGMEWPERVAEAVRLLQRNLRERATESAVDEPDDDWSAAYKSLGDVAIQMGSVEAIDAQIERMKRTGDRDPAVEISTIHRVKGLEWHTVFVCGVTDGLLPHMKARDTEEECRLFYVAVTRAKRVAVISIGGQKPSPFLQALGYVSPAVPAAPLLLPRLTGENPDREEEWLEAKLEENPGLPKPRLRLVHGGLQAAQERVDHKIDTGGLPPEDKS